MVKIFFQKNVYIAAALAQVTVASRTVLKLSPSGTSTPYVLSDNVSSVPIVLLALSRQKLAQMQLFDFAQNIIRPQLAAVAGEPEEAMRVTGRRRRGARTLRCAPAIDYRS